MAMSMVKHLAQTSGRILLKNRRTSGCYVYDVDGVEQARETFAVTSRSDGAEHVQCVRDASQFGVHLVLDALCFMSGDAHYVFTLRARADGPILAKATYRVTDGEIWVGRGDDVGQKLLPERANVFPLMRYFTGDMVADILDNGGQASIIVPDIRTLSDIGSAFMPLQSVRTVAAVEGQSNVFDVSGGAYDAPARLHLNDECLLAHYEFEAPNHKIWRCNLVDM
jgi:hypothetical protein